MDYQSPSSEDLYDNSESGSAYNESSISPPASQYTSSSSASPPGSPPLGADTPRNNDSRTISPEGNDDPSELSASSCDEPSDNPLSPSAERRRRGLRTSFYTQADALFRKNVAYQRRNWGTNACVVSLPALLCLFLQALQILLNNVMMSTYKCGCGCPKEFRLPDGTCPPERITCGPEYSTASQMPFCAVPEPPMWPAFVQVPANAARAAAPPGVGASLGLPPDTCRSESGQGCPTVILYTGHNRTAADAMASFLVPDVLYTSLRSVRKHPTTFLTTSDAVASAASRADSPPPAASVSAPPVSVPVGGTKPPLLRGQSGGVAETLSAPGLGEVHSMGGSGTVAGVAQAVRGKGQASKGRRRGRRQVAKHDVRRRLKEIVTIAGVEKAISRMQKEQSRRGARFMQQISMSSGGGSSIESRRGSSSERSSRSSNLDEGKHNPLGVRRLIKEWKTPSRHHSQHSQNRNTTAGYWVPSYVYDLSQVTPGTATYPGWSLLLEEAVSPVGWQANSSLLLLLPQCRGGMKGFTVNATVADGVTFPIRVECVAVDTVWRDAQADIDTELYAGYYQANPEQATNAYTAAFDFQDSNPTRYNPVVQYNSSYNNASIGGAPATLLRFARLLNLASNAFVKTFYSAGGSNSAAAGDAGAAEAAAAAAAAEIPLLFVKDFPKVETTLGVDFASLLGPLFYMWLLQLLLPVMAVALVYEKEQQLRVMMRMHGLKDGPYWLVAYIYFLLLSLAYIFFLVAFGSLIQLKSFTLNPYGLQFLLYLVYANTQIALAMLASTCFSHTRPATIATYFYVFATALLGQFLYRNLLESGSFSTTFTTALQLFPAFALYHGVYELTQSSLIGSYQASQGTLTWVTAATNGYLTAVAILAVEWLVFLLLAIYLDQVVSAGSGVRKHPLFFLRGCKSGCRKLLGSLKKVLGTCGIGDARVHAAFQEGMGGEKEDKAKGHLGGFDVELEKRKVQHHLGNADLSAHQHPSILCAGLSKVYPSRDGSGPKEAVAGMWLGVARGECFGMLGPNGAGKTTALRMMMGFLKATGGAVHVEGMDISDDMEDVYALMGVCPQHDLLWEQLTGREHLLFYGRLKNLCGAALAAAVGASLSGVRLLAEADKPVHQYSGGMKRRLSVAISLIGDPLVVYMDEPSTGLDPSSRMHLWSVVKRAKKHCAIVLTTHSMEEAEALCDRMGIFVRGRFACIGSAQELTARYGGCYIFTVTTPVDQEASAALLALSLSINASRIYNLSGTQKFEMPVEDVKISDAFAAVQAAKMSMNIQAWGLTNSTLEDVFIKVAKQANANVI
ncbi:hypothetical protein CLOM_g13925 [Closterium sp. NIES-68]|nr:hypothetical protein CLOM_g13925 [Closterium sp. NIES-68]